MDYARSLLHNEQIPTAIKQHTPWRRQVLNDKLCLPTVRENRSGVGWLEGTCWRGRQGRLEEEIEKLEPISKHHVCLQMECTFRGTKTVRYEKMGKNTNTTPRAAPSLLGYELCMKRGNLTRPPHQATNPATWNCIIEVAQTRADLELSNGLEMPSLE
jgi:hypothetical protein